MNGETRGIVAVVICIATVVSSIVLAFYLNGQGNQAKELQMMRDCVASGKNWALVTLQKGYSPKHECVESNFQRTGWVQRDD